MIILHVTCNRAIETVTFRRGSQNHFLTTNEMQCITAVHGIKSGPALRGIFLLFLLTRGMGSTSWVDRWESLVRHPWAMVSVSAKCCHCLPCCLLFTWSDKLLVQSHYRGCTQAVYLCMGLCHCHSHSHAGYLLIFHSHIPVCLSTPPNPCPSSVMNSFSHFSLSVTSPSLLHPSFSLRLIFSP